MAPLPPSLVACGRSHQLGPRAGDWLLRITSQLLQDTPAMLGSKPLAEVGGGEVGEGADPGDRSAQSMPPGPLPVYTVYPPPPALFFHTAFLLPSALPVTSYPPISLAPASTGAVTIYPPRQGRGAAASAARLNRSAVCRAPGPCRHCAHRAFQERQSAPEELCR